ncbi:BamA/TamA family outer membrane protein, partial [Candidatus Desantisbacteria bacterium]|nr:BamA/TamA family outer membrane protein [Candidatus Desantisbacteria bacterium]
MIYKYRISLIFLIISAFLFSGLVKQLMGEELLPLKLPVIQPPVTSFTLLGNKTFKSKKLRSLTKLGNPTLFNIPQFSEQELEKDLRRIKSFYQANGFFFVELEHIVKFGQNKAWAEILLNINEGVRTKISDIKFNGNFYFKTFEIEALIETKKDEFLNPFQIIEDKKKILMFYNNKGHIYAEVKHSLQFSEDNKNAELIFSIDERQIVYVDKIIISGLKLTKEKIVKREIEIEEGDILSWQKLYNTQKNINNIGIFTDVRFEPENLDETKDRINLKLTLKEQLPRYFGFGVGYGTIDRERILLEWSHENLFGENQTVSINGTFKSWEDLYQISFVNPRIFDTYFSMITTSTYRRTIRKDYKVGELAVSVDFRRKIIESIIGSAKYKLQNTDLFAIKDTASDEIKIDQKGISHTQSFIYTLMRESRDSIFYPHNGMLHTLSYQYAGGILSGDNSFKRYIYNGSIFVDIWKELVLGYRIQTGFIKEFGASKYVPVEEKFHSGGINSIRGYSEDSVGPK